ncbi:transposase [Rhodococcus ruber]|uniref:transposase n=1 Tax=Rhodococcus ruber TaxID=1830 RepID=UPI003CCA9F49
MAPFHVVAHAGTKLDLCRQRIQQHTCGHRGRKGDPLYGARCTVRTRQELLSDRQRRRLALMLAGEQHLPFAATRWAHAALRRPHPRDRCTLKPEAN